MTLVTSSLYAALGSWFSSPHNRDMLTGVRYYRRFRRTIFTWFVVVALITLTVRPATSQDAAPNANQLNELDRQLLQAANDRNPASVRQLLKQGANIEAKDQRGSTALIIAAENGNTAIVKLLLESGADVAARDNYQETALIQAARTMNPEAVEILLERTSDIKAKNEALFTAAEGGPVVIQMTDADVMPPGQNAPAVAEPPEQPWVATVRLLLDRGADLEARDEEKETPLIRAASFGQTDIFQLLLQRGADINARDKRGMTVLIAAACACAVATMNSTYDIMKILLEKGVNLNARTYDGRTALMMAAGSPDDPASVELLLSKGADPTLKDKQGDTALTVAVKSDRPDKVRLLKRAMAKAH